MALKSVTISRPEAGEYVPYYGRYIDRVPDGDLIEELERQTGEMETMLAGIGEERARFRYEPGKWSVKEVLGHINDSERVFAYRLLRIARGDATPMPGFDQDAYVPEGRFDERPLADVLGEYGAVRAATLSLLRGLDAEWLTRRGTANDAPVSVRALAYIIAGHDRHHAGTLQERYGLR